MDQSGQQPRLDSRQTSRAAALSPAERQTPTFFLLLPSELPKRQTVFSSKLCKLATLLSGFLSFCVVEPQGRLGPIRASPYLQNVYVSTCRRATCCDARCRGLSSAYTVTQLCFNGAVCTCNTIDIHLCHSMMIYLKEAKAQVSNKTRIFDFNNHLTALCTFCVLVHTDR